MYFTLLGAALKHFDKILLYISDAACLIHPCSAFKVEIQASVVEVHASDSGVHIVADKGFCMDKARVVLDIFTPFLIRLG